MTETALQLVQGMKNLPQEYQQRLNSPDPSIRGEALVDVLGMVGVSTFVSGRLLEQGGQKFSQALAKQATAQAEAQTAVKAKIENNFYAEGARFESNIVNGVAKANLRLEYEQASRDLLSQTQRMLSQGIPEEQVARWAVERRNQLKVEYRELTPPNMLADIEARNIREYKNPLGPNVEQLRAEGKSWQQIIEGAAKPGGKDFDFSPPGFNGSSK
jgi:soluble lytic murein transglycosylase-like protein